MATAENLSYKGNSLSTAKDGYRFRLSPNGKWLDVGGSACYNINFVRAIWITPCRDNPKKAALIVQLHTAGRPEPRDPGYVVCGDSQNISGYMRSVPMDLGEAEMFRDRLYGGSLDAKPHDE